MTMRSILRTRGLLVTIALCLASGLTACGSEDQLAPNPQASAPGELLYRSAEGLEVYSTSDPQQFEVHFMMVRVIDEEPSTSEFISVPEALASLDDSQDVQVTYVQRVLNTKDPDFLLTVFPVAESFETEGLGKCWDCCWTENPCDCSFPCFRSCITQD